MEIQTEFPGAGKMLNENLSSNSNSKPKVIVIMGATGAGKSKLAIDLASHFPVQVINADSMQVYQGLDVLTNKVRPEEQKGVVHHLLGTISSNVEFTAKDFRDHAIPLIDEISSRNFLPVIVGGTNYYIQSLVSPFLMDVATEDTEVNCLLDPPENEQPCPELKIEQESFDYTYDCLKAIDPVAANRLHPNDHRKVHQYLNLYARFGIPPSKVLQEKTAENWGHVDNSRFDFCFICVDASLSALDPFVDKRVDDMIEAGLLDEVFDIYRSDADYTKGLRQAIGVREFNDFLTCYFHKHEESCDASLSQTWSIESFKQTIQDILYGSCDDERKVLLTAAIDQMKFNTRRLVRRQRRRLQRLQMLFGWEIHYIDVTSSILGASDETWAAEVVLPAATTIESFLNRQSCPENARNNTDNIKLKQRDLWSQYICEACGNKVLRGAHEWEQHRQGRSHRKRISKLKKFERMSVN
ncbi:PREDICTED: tRNA dimethylallyltransferase 2 [Ipomoea nil]|uniref:tRNA dimethylallyltransferase 2 n=1 Tax=Ipomoea nil TaxID=35883 RepID=UPI000900E506|nr:PREDICTED: tRNA dimethylallyltransferase 2 [Ipomoea nil]